MKSTNRINNAFIAILSRFVKCHRVVFAGKPVVLSHGMSFETSGLLELLLSGRQRIFYYHDGKLVNHILTSDEMFFVPVGHPYKVDWEFDCRRIGIVAGEFGRLSMSWHNHTSQRSRIVRTSDLWYSAGLKDETDLFALFSAMTGRIGAPGDSRVTCQLAELVVERIIEHLETEQQVVPERSAHQTFQRICTYLEANSRNPVSRKELAANFRVHPDYVTRLFKEYAQCGFSEYLLRLRMLSALWYLRNSKMPVNEIAATCGFYDISHFIKIFRDQ